jgi:hypothetical protein
LKTLLRFVLQAAQWSASQHADAHVIDDDGLVAQVGPVLLVAGQVEASGVIQAKAARRLARNGVVDRFPARVRYGGALAPDSAGVPFPGGALAPDEGPVAVLAVSLRQFIGHRLHAARLGFIEVALETALETPACADGHTDSRQHADN